MGAYCLIGERIMYSINGSPQVAQISVDVGLRTYMLKVYNLVAGGLGVTGTVAWLIANTSLVDIFYTRNTNGAMHFTVWGWIGLFAPLLLILVASVGAVKSWSSSAMYAFYIILTGTMGIGLSSVMMLHSVDLIKPLLVTIMAFASLGIWGYTTKRDLTGLGSFCIMGLFGIIGVGILSMITGWHGADLITAIIGLGVFAGLTAYDTQKIKAQYLQTRDDSASMAVMGAVGLYLDFVNMFLELVRIFSNSNK
jgi:uncharacterized protein